MQVPIVYSLSPQLQSPDAGVPLLMPVDKEGMKEEKLSHEQARDRFFADTAFIGIMAALPATRLCWTLNNHFRTTFANVPEDDIHMLVDEQGRETAAKRKAKPTGPTLFMPAVEAAVSSRKEYLFPVYCHYIPNSNFRHIIYKLKCDTVSLLQGEKNRQYDYLWLVQTADPAHDAHMILEVMRGIGEIQMAQELRKADVDKSRDNLLL